MRLPRVEDFPTRRRGPQTAARVGIWLGIAFGVCFLTGLWSHWQQTTPTWLTVPTSPAGLYRFTQGLHVISGTVAVPLLLVKLWSVYPRLFVRPPRAPGALVLHGLERLSVLALVAAGIFQLASGLTNIVQWYPWAFSFRSTHYAVAWVAIGALLLHIAVKLPVIRTALGEPLEDATGSGLSRRGLLRVTGGAAAVAVVATAGQSVSWLRPVSVLAVRSGDGPQGVPINRTAKEAGVPGAVGDDWALEVVHRGETTRFSLADLEAMPQATEDLPIACVEGWSVQATWSGVPVRDLVAAVGAPGSSRVLVSSLQTRYAFGSSELPPQFVDDARTLLALRLSGEELALDHGYPCRIIAPNRPGVRQTKWVTRLEVFG